MPASAGLGSAGLSPGRAQGAGGCQGWVLEPIPVSVPLLTWVTAAGWLWAAVRPCRLSEHPTSPPNPPRCGMGAQAEAESLCWSSGAELCLHPSGAAPSTAGAWAVPEHPQGTDLLQVPLWGSARPWPHLAVLDPSPSPPAPSPNPCKPILLTWGAGRDGCRGGPFSRARLIPNPSSLWVLSCGLC